MSKREFLMLAHTYKKGKHRLGGHYISEKCDGHRILWDGGITRGLLKYKIPWANNDKDERLREFQIATGLWSRYGNVIHAPDWWLDSLPKIMLDGEGFTRRGPGGRQEAASIMKQHQPDFRWRGLKFKVFDMPPLETVFADGYITDTNYQKMFYNIPKWVEKRMAEIKFEFDYRVQPTIKFFTVYKLLQKWLKGNQVAIAHKQTQLPYPQDEAYERALEICTQITDMKGEGCIIRNPDMPYTCERVHHMLKLKPYDDAEGVVVGYTTGRMTDKGSRLMGMMGALILRLKGGIRLEISGFTDQERILTGQANWDNTTLTAKEWAVCHPGYEVPNSIEALHFPRGTSVTFRYRGLSDTDIPQEARYWRKRENL